MKFSDFANYLNRLEATASRLEMAAHLAELFKQLEPKEIAQACYLMQGKLVPKYQSLEFQLSVKMVIRAIAQVDLDLSPDEEMSSTQDNLFVGTKESGVIPGGEGRVKQMEVTQTYKREGDLGLVAEIYLNRHLDKKHYSPDKKLSLLAVYQQLKDIALESGTGSQERKLGLLAVLFQKLDPISAKFVARIIVGKLRLGFSTMTMIDGLSWTKTSSKRDSKTLEEAYQKQADVGRLAQIYLTSNKPTSDLLAGYSVQVGVPVIPALCQRLNSAAEIIDKLGEVIAEPKYDGLRLQIHINKKGWGKDKEADKSKTNREFYRAYTRNLDEVSAMFPELAAVVEQLDCTTCILDAEVVGVSKETGRLLSFQQTVTRKRKHGVLQKAAEIPVRFYVFDVLSLDGKFLLNTPLEKRKNILKKLIVESPELVNTPFILTNNPDQLKKFHEKQLVEGLEGAVIKKKDGLYRSGRKGWRWVKIKEEEGSRGKLSDTIDCVVMGYYYGLGKRTQFGIGAFLVGVLGKDQKIETVAKIGTGITDDQFLDLKNRVDQVAVATKPKLYQVHKNLTPDVWVEPAIVVEIAADEITKSPVHTAKLALRFPRLVGFRDDKDWSQATTLQEFEQIKI